MKPEDTARAYDQITHLWDREGFDRSNGIEAHKRALRFTRKRGRALDVGCGCTGRFIDLLLKERFTPEGVDCSGAMLELARKRHPDVPFYHQDICEWEIPGSYNFITAWDSIWHVPMAQQKPVLAKLVAALNPGGVLIFSFGGTDEVDERTDTAMGPEVYYASLGINGFLSLMAELGCVVRHFAHDQYPELHTYLIAQKPDSQG